MNCTGLHLRVVKPMNELEANGILNASKSKTCCHIYEIVINQLFIYLWSWITLLSGLTGTYTIWNWIFRNHYLWTSLQWGLIALTFGKMRILFTVNFRKATFKTSLRKKTVAFIWKAIFVHNNTLANATNEYLGKLVF